MSTGEIRKILDDNKGPYGAFAMLITTAIAALQLPDASIERLRNVWPLLIAPTIVVLVGYAFNAYIEQERCKTKVQEGIFAKLDHLTGQVERMLANHLDDKLYFDKELDGFRERMTNLDNAVARIHEAVTKE